MDPSPRGTLQLGSPLHRNHGKHYKKNISSRVQKVPRKWAWKKKFWWAARKQFGLEAPVQIL